MCCIGTNGADIPFCSGHAAMGAAVERAQEERGSAAALSCSTSMLHPEQEAWRATAWEECSSANYSPSTSMAGHGAPIGSRNPKLGHGAPTATTTPKLEHRAPMGTTTPKLGHGAPTATTTPAAGHGILMLTTPNIQTWIWGSHGHNPKSPNLDMGLPWPQPTLLQEPIPAPLPLSSSPTFLLSFFFFFPF